MTDQMGYQKQARGSFRCLLLLACLSFAFSAVSAVVPATASAVVYNLDFVFSPSTGTVPPLGSVTLTDLGASIRFEVTNLAGAGSRFDSLYFNFHRAGVNPNQLAFSNVSATAGTYGTTLAPTTTTRVNTLRADGDGYYDGKFAYTNSNFLGHGLTLSFDLAATGHDLDVSDFNFFSLPGGGTGTYIMASHIRSLPGSGDSLWVGTTAVVPLPAAMWLFGSGLASLIPMIRRQSMS